MDLLALLNPQQRLAVQHGTGPALVLAGAGSGKTRVIACRITFLIQNGGSRAQNILAVTFTNKAAQEMRERVQKLLGPARTSEPLITTFHSLCVRILRHEIHQLGYRRDFSIYDTDDQRRLIKQLIQEGTAPGLEITPREALSRISYAKNHDVSPETFIERFDSPDAEDMAWIYREYERRLRSSNSLDFDDLLLKTVQVLSKHPDRRDYYSDWYRYILVDEYQDTNRPQYELLQLLTSRHKNVFVVGDEDQSIYKFRGADINNILNFERDFPGTRMIKLEQNYRSTGNILKVAGAVVQNNTERKGKVLWTENHSGDIITCHKSSSARQEAVWVAQTVQDSMADNPDLRFGVLYRANFLSRNFEDVLLERGIPYCVVGSVGFFSRMEVKDMLAYLRILFNPEDDVALTRIINTPPRGIGSSTIETLTRTALEKRVPLLQALREVVSDPAAAGRAARPLARFLEMLEGWMAARDTLTPGELLQRIVLETEYRRFLEKQESAEEAENRMANLEELVRAAKESEERRETVFEFLDRASLSSEMDRYDSNARVTLMTLHSAKGLEFDVVFLAGLEEGLFPHAQSFNSPKDLEEERRLCYVGITRARKKLYLTWSPYRRSFGGDTTMASIASRFLKEMPVELLEGLEGSEPTYVYDSSDSQLRHEADDEIYETARENIRQFFQRNDPPRRASPGMVTERPAPPRQQGGKLLKSGMLVRHAQFGDGIILNREKSGDDIKLTITFSRVGKKTLIERYAKLQAL